MAFGSESNNAKEIGLIWERFVPIERKVGEIDKSLVNLNDSLNDIRKKLKQPSESQAEAQTAANSARSYRTNVRKMKEEVEEHLGSIRETQNWLSELKPLIQDSSEAVKSSELDAKALLEQVQKVGAEVEELKRNVSSDTKELVTLLEGQNNLQEELENAREQISQIEELESNAQSILKSVTTNHSKVRELKNEILGHDSEAEDGTSEYIEGLKDQLENSYNQLQEDSSTLSEYLSHLKDLSEKAFNEFSSQSEDTLNNVINEQKEQYTDVYEQIVRLLPTALTAGLSGAYDEKVVQENTDLESYRTTFSRAIIGLVIISLIPFAVDSYLFLYLGNDLVQVISDTPKLILSIFPLYLPILWIAYSANKKINLSKRLIEEYTHKGVLSKTFEGLSKQIEELEDGNISTELREKLLLNILSVNAENPGKLISDYKTTDHPLMDALDKSMKLGTALEKLRNIPGFSKLVAKLEKENQALIAKANQVSAQGLNGAAKTEQVVDEVSKTSNN